MWGMNSAVFSKNKSFSNSTNNSYLDYSKSEKMTNKNQNVTNISSPIQFGFNFYFNNIKTSSFTPMNSPKEPFLSKNNKNTQQIPIHFVFKSCLEKSGFKIIDEQIITRNEFFNEYNNGNNYYNDLNYYNFPLNSNYTSNNNSIINNIYPTITKVTNVKILSNNNSADVQRKNHKENEKDKDINIEKRKQEIKNKLLDVNITKNDDEKDEGENKDISNKDNKEDLLTKKSKILFACSESKANNALFSKKFIKKKRLRKNNEQILLLSKFFNEHKNWSKKEIKEMSKNIGLKETKIYKWLWDQKNKEYNRLTKFIVNKKYTSNNGN